MHTFPTKTDDELIEHLTSIVNYIETCARDGKWGDLNNALTHVDCVNTTTQALITWLRTTCAMKSHLPVWDVLLDQVRTVMQSRGLDTERLLRGLT